jgi:hypothetical protein
VWQRHDLPTADHPYNVVHTTDNSYDLWSLHHHESTHNGGVRA